MIIKDNFVSRHNGPSAEEQQKMLATIGVKTMDELIENINGLGRIFYG